MSDQSDHGIRSVEITVSIIRTLQARGQARVSELADHLDRSKSTIHEHLQTLEANRLVTRNGDAFRLSLTFLEIAHDVKTQHYKYSIITETVDKLATETGEYAQFASSEHGKLIYLYRSSASSEINEHFELGIKEPLHATAHGKAILAFMPEERVADIVDQQGLERKTDNTITDSDTLLDELKDIRKRGYAIDDEEFAKGLRCVAAPVVENHRYHSEVLGAVGTLGPVTRLTDDRLGSKLTTQVKQSANLIEIASNAA